MFSEMQVKYLFKNYVIFFFGRGGHQKIALDYRGRGGGRSSESKKEVRIFSMAPKVSGVSEVTYNLICLFLGEGLTFLLYKGEPKPEIVV